MSSPFRAVDGVLSAADVPLIELAERFDTPLYVYDRAAIGARLDAVREAFAAHPTRICYSVKANSNLRLLAWLAERGVGFDVVSAGELARTAAVGVPASEVVFAGVGKTDAELVRGIEAGLWMLNLESVEEARRVAALAGERGRTAVPVSLRLNPDVDAGTHPHITTGRAADKFGIAADEVGELVEWTVGIPELDLIGLHMHLGSQITDVDPYRRGIRHVLAVAEDARAAGAGIAWINAGGGFGIGYDGRPVPSPVDYAAAILPGVERFGAGLLLELGRSLVGAAGLLLARVLYRKRRGGRRLVVLDAGMTDLLRPALYGARHRIVPVVGADRSTEPTDVAGPICESSDFLARGADLPALEPGELVAVLDAGAYGMAMASHYNTHPRPAEVWVTESGGVELVRRRETEADLLAVELEALERG